MSLTHTVLNLTRSQTLGTPKMRPVLEDLLYFEYVEPPSSVDRVIVEKSRRHECLEPTNASRLREEHKHSALLSALIHDSSSEEY